MKAIRIIISLCVALLSAAASAAVLQMDVESLRPTSIAMTPSGTLLAAACSEQGVHLIANRDGLLDSWSVVREIPGADDAVIWQGFGGKTWLFYTREGELRMTIGQGQEPARMQWSEEKTLARGYCVSAPVVLRNGAAVLAAYLTEDDCSGTLISFDMGQSWTVRPTGLTPVEKVHSTRPDPILMAYKNSKLLLIEKSLGYPWLRGRTSKDFGQSWSEDTPYVYAPATPSAFAVTRSGKWIMAKNGRLDQNLYYTSDRLILYMSDDQGETWYGDLILDGRHDVVSPCICAAGDGYIYVLYAYRPFEGSSCQLRIVKTSEVEVNNAAPTRMVTAQTNIAIASASGMEKKFKEDMKVYQSLKGKPAGEPLIVASYNVELRHDKEKAPWPERLEYVNEVFRTHDFDVVGVQEPWAPEYKEMVDKLGDRWASVWACTNPYKDSFANSIFYKKEKIELLDHDIFWYTEVPGKPGFGGTSSRLCIWAKLRDKTTGNIFFIFNSHFDFSSYEAALTSSRLLISKVREIAHGYPVFCTGDYNSSDQNPAMKLLAAGPYLKDSMTEAKKPVNPKMTTMGRYNSPDKAKKDGYHIDHIFFTPGLSRVDTWEILYEEHNGLWGGSDHNPIKLQWQILK